MTERTAPSFNPTTTFITALLVGAAVAAGTLWNGTTAQALAEARAWLAPLLSWYYVVVVAFLLLLVGWLGVGRYRDVRLGGDEERPEFTTRSWLAMLFAAGTGVGLVFWSIAEPVSHWLGNPFLDPDAGPNEAARVALRLSFFHWGLNGWAIFASVGLAMAYFRYRRKLPLTLSSTLATVIGPRVHGPLGYAVDLFTVAATFLGIATTLGLGIRQLNTGLDALYGLPVNAATQFALLAGVAVVITAALATELRRGMALLSEAGVWLTVGLLAFFLTFGPTQHLLGMLVQSTGDYLQNLLGLSFWTGTHGENAWQDRWTTFFWGWWIAWSPFVGMFIARISRGRTLREYVFGVLLVPSLFSFVWIALFGGTALHIEQFAGGGIADTVRGDVALALFRTLEVMDLLPGLALVAGTAALVLIVVYVITSADAGALVIGTILADGNPEPPMPLRLFLGLAIAVVTGVLLLAGGLETLQDAVVLGALPFSVVLLMMVVGMLKGLHEERQSPRPGRKHRRSREPWTGSDRPPEAHERG